jgi:hypothetical protein
MATIENRVTQDGDVLLIRAEAPIIGLIYLTDFIDNTTGEDNSTFFTKQFRYSTDGINFSSWSALTTVNLAGIQVRSSDTFLIEYKYTRTGGGAQDLAFNAVELNGKLEPRECGPVYKQSIFADYFSCSDTEVLGWAINVTEKMYRKGLMPSFVQRAASSSSLEDRDYLDFWRTVAQFFAFIVLYTRQLERIHLRPDLLAEYLTQWGIFGVMGQSLDKLVYLLETSRDQFRQRGTAGIVARGVGEAGVDGELLRLVGYQEPRDEFLINAVSPVYAGWCVGFNSPTYRGVGSQPQLNKVPGDAVSFGDTPLRISSSLTYEVTFTVQVLGGPLPLDFGCMAYDEYGQPVSLLDSTNGRPQSWFFQRAVPNQAGVEYQVRGLIYHYMKPNQLPSDATLAFGVGQHLRSVKEICSILPLVAGDFPPDAIKLNNFRVAPCSAPYSLGFVDSGKFTQTWIRNRNTELTENQLNYQIKHFLLPYNASYVPVIIPEVPATTD